MSGPKRTLIVVNNPRDWQFDIAGVEVVAAQDYLNQPEFASLKSARVFNLCRSYHYQSHGYYVSLLAAARGHKPLPSVMTIQDMRSRLSARLISEELDDIIQKSLKSLSSHEFSLSVYFGRNLARRYDRLCSRLYQLFETPLLRAEFYRPNGRWQIRSLGPIAASEIPAEHKAFVIEAARDFLGSRHAAPRRRKSYRYDLAILVNEAEAEPPSDKRAIKNFMRAADRLGLCPELIDREAIGRLVEFDALFIRETTNVNHHTYRFARKAEAEGLVVIDDPLSILRCTNKVYLAELMRRHRIPTPLTFTVHHRNRQEVLSRFDGPIVIKQPDSAFSKGVIKAETAGDFLRVTDELLEKSALIIAQEFMPTSFDWRIGILDRRPLFACKYYMATDHWQIYKREPGRTVAGDYEAVALDKVPARVLRLALKAAEPVGAGFYGVDIKESAGRLAVIEINDNPSVDSEVEDGLLGASLYDEVMRVFLSRIEQRANPHCKG